MPNKILSICVPVFNKYNYTKYCLNDLLKLPDNHEIIVIDNGSTDETQKELKNNSRIKYLRQDTNLGFAKACNIGYKNSISPNVMFLNNDIKIKSDYKSWTNIIINSLENNNIIGPTGGMIDIKNDFKFLYETNDDKKQINYMSGWCLSAKKEVFDKLIINNYDGPFSEEFGKAYYEDTDLSFRANNFGFTFKLVDIPIIHIGKISSNQINTYELYNNARKIFLNKWKTR